jgi:hypothetical protein
VLDTQTGRVLAQAEAPEGWAVTKLALAAPPPDPALSAGGELAVYALLSTPPVNDFDEWWYVDRRATLLVHDPQHLSSLAAWPLAQFPSALAVHPDGKQAYFLAGTSYSFSWSRTLVNMDLASGAVSSWSLPGGCLSLAAGPLDKVYVADTLGDRLWRLDPRTRALSYLSLPGAPIALAARPQ